MQKQMVLHNGQFVPEVQFSTQNRAFRYGDGIFETIRVRSGKALWFSFHFQRILSSLRLLKINPHPDFDKGKLQNLLNELIEHNNIQDGGRLRLSIYRNDGGLYTPADNGCSYIAEVIPLEHNEYRLNEEGLHLGYYKEHRKASTQISRIKTNNALVFVLASLYARNKSYDDVVIYNHFERIAEATHSNIWIVKDGKLLTPSLSEGAMYGIMRRLILTKVGGKIISELDLVITEESISKQDLEEAEEVLLSNAINGVQWVRKLGRRSYKNNYSKEIIRIINEFAAADLKTK